MVRESRQNALRGESDCNEGDLPWTRPVLRRERWGAVPSLGRMALGGTTRRESAKRVGARPAKFRRSPRKSRGGRLSLHGSERVVPDVSGRAYCTTARGELRMAYLNSNVVIDAPARASLCFSGKTTRGPAPCAPPARPIPCDRTTWASYALLDPTRVRRALARRPDPEPMDIPH